MSLAAAFADRGVIIVEYALAPSDIARLAADIPRRDSPRRDPAPPRLRTWLAHHPVLTDLTRNVAGTGLDLAHASLVHHVARQPWRTGWLPASNLASHPMTDLVLVIALDACREEHGPWEVLLGSHRDDPHEAARRSAICLLEPGDIVILDPRVRVRAQRGRSPTGLRLVQMDYVTSAPARLGAATGPSPGHA